MGNGYTLVVEQHKTRKHRKCDMEKEITIADFIRIFGKRGLKLAKTARVFALAIFVVVFTILIWRVTSFNRTKDVPPPKTISQIQEGHDEIESKKADLVEERNSLINEVEAALAKAQRLRELDIEEEARKGFAKFEQESAERQERWKREFDEEIEKMSKQMAADIKKMTHIRNEELPDDQITLWTIEKERGNRKWKSQKERDEWEAKMTAVFRRKIDATWARERAKQDEIDRKKWAESHK